MFIRPATVADAEPICEIYNREVLESTVPLELVPRTVPEQQAWIQHRSGGLAVVVAELDDEVVGFGGLSFLLNLIDQGQLFSEFLRLFRN